MNQTIWKKVLKASRRQEVMIPEGSTILSCGAQKDDIVIWYLVRNEKASEVPVKILAIPTGSYVEDQDGSFLGTVQLIHPDMALVFHVFVKYTTGYADRA